MTLSRTERQALIDAHLCWTDGDGAMPSDIRILLHRRWIKKQRGGINPQYEWTPDGIAALELAEQAQGIQKASPNIGKSGS